MVNLKKVENKTKKNYRSFVIKGEVYWFDPLEKAIADKSPLAVILSGSLHNKNSDFVVFNVATSKKVKVVRDSFEVPCKVGGKKIKIIACAIHMFNKKVFFKQGKYLGKISKETQKELNQSVKRIFELDNEFKFN